MMLEHLFVAFNYSGHKLDHLTSFAGSDIVLDHPVELSRYHRTQMVLPAGLLEGNKISPSPKVILRVPNTLSKSHPRWECSLCKISLGEIS